MLPGNENEMRTAQKELELCEGFFRGLDRGVDVGRGVSGRDEEGFVLAARHVNATVD